MSSHWCTTLHCTLHWHATTALSTYCGGHYSQDSTRRCWLLCLLLRPHCSLARSAPDTGQVFSRARLGSRNRARRSRFPLPRGPRGWTHYAYLTRFLRYLSAPRCVSALTFVSSSNRPFFSAEFFCFCRVCTPVQQCCYIITFLEFARNVLAKRSKGDVGQHLNYLLPTK